jgi:hypothetical protein
MAGTTGRRKVGIMPSGSAGVDFTRRASLLLPNLSSPQGVVWDRKCKVELFIVIPFLSI